MKKIIVMALICTLNIYPNFINHRINSEALFMDVPESVVELYSQPVTDQLQKGEVVIVKNKNKPFRFGIFKDSMVPDTFVEIQLEHSTKIIHKNKILQFSPFWQTTLQPNPSAELFEQLVQKYKQLTPTAPSPFVDVINIDPTSKIVVIGDLHGNFDALNRILVDLFKKQIIDKDLKLAPGYKLLCTGDYIDRGHWHKAVNISRLLPKPFFKQCWEQLNKPYPITQEEVFTFISFIEPTYGILEYQFDGTLELNPFINI